MDGALYHMDTAPPSRKRSRDGEDENAYIPTQCNGGTGTTVIFSLKEEKGALVRALKPFEVSIKGTVAYLIGFLILDDRGGA